MNVLPFNGTLNDADRLATSAEWLAKLRWVAVAGQLLTIGVVAGPLGVDIPVVPLLTLVAVTAGTNVAFWRAVRSRRPSRSGGDAARRWRHTLGALMLLDLLVLTGMLAVTGGPTNPFAIFYFVNLALCGLLLPARWAWLLAVVAVVAFAGLRCVHLPITELQDPGRLQTLRQLSEWGAVGGWRLVDAGALVAFAACATVIVAFATRVTSELGRSERARRRVEDLRARSEKLEALGTLAAGAAHELATPLSTIAVVAKELQRELAGGSASQETMADIELIRSEVDRCRAILDRMSMRSGEAPGEVPAEAPVAELIEEALAELPDRSPVRAEFEYAAAGARITAPRTALTQALRALMQNAIDAGRQHDPDDPAPVRVVVGPALGGVEVAIHDRGDGMPADVLERAGEPFFTTKPPGQGMGLGLFLARSIVDRVGGELRIESEPGAGSTVRVTLPARFEPVGGGVPTASEDVSNSPPGADASGSRTLSNPQTSGSRHETAAR